MILTKKEQQGHISLEDYELLKQIIRENTLELIIGKLENFKNLAVASRFSGIHRNFLWLVANRKQKLSLDKIMEWKGIFLDGDNDL